MSGEIKAIIVSMVDHVDLSAGVSPNQAMSDLNGKPLIQHVFERVRSSMANEVVIATNSTRIGMAAEDFGATVCMLVDADQQGIGRIAEVAEKMEWNDEDIVVDIPADAPFITTDSINQVVSCLVNNEAFEFATLYENRDLETATDHELVKVVTDVNNRAIFFSRELIPRVTSEYQPEQFHCQLDICACRVGLLRVFRNLPVGNLEQSEKLDFCRLLHSGFNICSVEAEQSLGKRVGSEQDIDAIGIQLASSQ